MTALVDILAQRLRQLRFELKLSQKEVALGASIPQSQYSRIENAKVEPSLSTLGKLATFFKIPAALLLFEEKVRADIREEHQIEQLSELLNFLNKEDAGKNKEKKPLRFESIEIATSGYKFDREEANV